VFLAPALRARYNTDAGRLEKEAKGTARRKRRPKRERVAGRERGRNASGQHDEGKRRAVAADTNERESTSDRE